MGGTFLVTDDELTEDDRLVRLTGVLLPLADPLTAADRLVLFDVVVDGRRRPLDLVGVGDLDAPLDDAGVDSLDLDDVGVSDLSS